MRLNWEKSKRSSLIKITCYLPLFRPFVHITSRGYFCISFISVFFFSFFFLFFGSFQNGILPFSHFMHYLFSLSLYTYLVLNLIFFLFLFFPFDFLFIFIFLLLIFVTSCYIMCTNKVQSSFIIFSYWKVIFVFLRL